MIDIKGINKAKLLVALYNSATPRGMGFLHYNPSNLTEQDAEELLKETTSFDYLLGRVMKVDIGGNTMRNDLYDRDNGYGKVERIVNGLR